MYTKGEAIRNMGPKKISMKNVKNVKNSFKKKGGQDKREIIFQICKQRNNCSFYFGPFATLSVVEFNTEQILLFIIHVLEQITIT